MKAVLWLLFIFPVVAIASDGGWQASATGPALANRGEAASSRPLIPPAGVAGVMTDVAWRYTL
ncbi:flagellar protein FlhE, partial [Erwinia amylovora]|uniref:flagellar protein FlhE n=1 Tax=Erwinia amylovora TaxID=552 RepID=UPI002B27B9F9